MFTIKVYNFRRNIFYYNFYVLHKFIITYIIYELIKYRYQKNYLSNDIECPVTENLGTIVYSYNKQMMYYKIKIPKIVVNSSYIPHIYHDI